MVNLKIPHEIEAQFDGMVVILGANGAGKSTLLRTMHGMEKSECFWDGVSAKASKAERGFVSQTPVMLAGNVARNLHITAKLKSISKSDATAQIQSLAKDYGIENLLKQSAQSLSGGETALVSFVRALMGAPNILLLDEITANLDPKNTARIEASMGNFVDQDGVVFFVTHIISQAKRLADYVIFVHEGRIIFADKSEKFWNDNSDPHIRKYISGELD